MSIITKIIELLKQIIALLTGIDDPEPDLPDLPPIDPPTPPTQPRRKLIWRDEFQGTLGPQWHFWTGPHRDAVNDNQHARIIGDKLVMSCQPHPDGKPRTSYLRTWNDKDMGNNPMLIDPTQGPIYIEASINFSRAYNGTQGAWWAFWLFAPDNWNNAGQKKWDSRLPRMEPYDGNADTGMEVDILEYVPHLPTRPGSSGRRNGFNCAAYIDLEGGALHKETPDGHGFMYDINDYINKNVDLSADRYYKLGFRQTADKYEFFFEDEKFWEITDPRFITNTKSNALIMSWEVDDGLWGESGPKFNDLGKTVHMMIDYVRVYREE